VSSTPLAALVMAAGLGTRMKSAQPKHLQPLLGRRLVDWVLAATTPLEPAPFLVVCSPNSSSELESSLPAPIEIVIQEVPLGTADAVRSGRSALEGFSGDLLVLAGDTPLLTADLLARLVEEHRASAAVVTVLSFEPEDPGAYGRIVRDERGMLAAIVEAADASPEQLAIREVNSSCFVFRAPLLWSALDRLEPRNAKGELYLTDVVRVLTEDGNRNAIVLAPESRDLDGVNTKAELASAAAVPRDRIVTRHLLSGVTVVDPATTWIEPDVEIEPDAVIHPFTVLRGRTRVASGAEVGPHAVIVDSEVGPGALVGPFCYLRPGSLLEARAKAGSFVEVKNTRLRAGAKVPHLSYMGDADVGEGANIAAGNITANFPHEPGRPKARTVIGKNVRTGVHNAFVAPIAIGDDAWIGAGSTITEDVPAGALAIARARQVNKEGHGGRAKPSDGGGGGGDD
jgi:bifunctional UDP-N-acetylglucosamine pyrophosphorylase / glucosamine-1-phosphate N-acetyltransferase